MTTKRNIAILIKITPTQEVLQRIYKIKINNHFCVLNK